MMNKTPLWFFVSACLVAVSCGGGGVKVKGVEAGFCHGVADGTPCDDQNPCTQDDRCGMGTCLGMAVEDGISCDDGLLCTSGDQCFAGVCGGVETDCAAWSSQCTSGTCSPLTGQCEAEPTLEGEACDDNKKCTVEDVCQAGYCIGQEVVCDDASQPCVKAECSPDSGQCQWEPKGDGEECDDGDLCTQDDECQAGECAGTAPDCSDLDGPCQSGQCDPQHGLCTVVPVPNGTVCDDGNPCTDGESCQVGSCGGAVQVPDGNLCDDGDKCTEGETCVAGVCTASPKDCSEISNSACIEGVCNPDLGECEGVPVEDPACSCWEAPDGEPCDDGLACTLDDVCADQMCIGALLDCTPFGDICNDGVCNPANGKCTKSPANEGGGCDDELDCTDGDSCEAGVCSGTPLDCSELDQPCAIGVCAEDLGGCTVLVSTDGTPCDDGDVCTGNDHCDDGDCVWGFDLCSACEGEEIGAACDEGNACTLNSTCKVTLGKLVCMGESLECPDMGPCMFGMCDTETGDCLPKQLPDGLFCFDQDPCTVTDVCESGQCVGSPKECDQGDLPCAKGVCQPVTGVCQLEPSPEQEECDDDDLCTFDDECTGGLCLGTPKVCEGGDGGPCMTAECNPETGDCGLPLPDGTECDDQDVCTAGDKCEAGQCVGNDICFCMDKLDGEECDDGYKCTEVDVCKGGGCTGQPIDCSIAGSICNTGVCDPASGDCVPVPMPDGSPCEDNESCTVQDSCVAGVCVGSNMDCSSLDNQCGTGACDADSGACVFVAGPDGAPCDDGDFCTSADTCVDGACVGAVDLCVTCAGKLAGDSCEPGDQCTTNGQCKEVSGVLACVGEATDCAELDGACTTGVCDTETGDCVGAPKADGTACDDNDPCTENDGCASGVCQGSQIGMCGEAPLQCEGPESNDNMIDAIMLPTSDTPVTVLGWINPAGETDWYSVEVEAGQLVTVLSHAHCGSVLDTQIGVYYPDGVTALAVADDGAEGGFSLVDQVLAEESGVFFIGLTAFSASGTGSYLLDVQVTWPPPCVADAECGCDQMVCALDGPHAGQCIPAMGLEVEPNNAPPIATPLALESSLKAEFANETDQDWYVIALQPDIPVTLETGAFCDGVTDPVLWLYDELGLNVLASDSDSAGQGHARIESFFAPAPGNYRVRVQDEGANIGPYHLKALDARCEVDDDCGCEDQQCDGSPAAPGKCVPLVTAPELEEDTQPVPVTLGARVHSTLDVPYDLDTFVVSLAPGTYDFTTLSYCGVETDTHLAVVGPDGTELGEDEDGGEGFFALLSEVNVAIMGNYVVKVTGYGPTVGEYMVQVTYSQGVDDN